MNGAAREAALRALMERLEVIAHYFIKKSARGPVTSLTSKMVTGSPAGLYCIDDHEAHCESEGPCRAGWSRHTIVPDDISPL